MAEEFVSLNMSLTGSEEVISALREYIDNLVATGEAQKTTSASADVLSKALGDLVRPLEGVSKGLSNLSKTGKVASDSVKAVGDSNKTATDSVKVLADAVAAQTKTMADNAVATGDAAKAGKGFADSQDMMVAPTERQTIALENQTRQLIIQRDAAIAAIKKNQNFAENFAASAPKLTRSAMLITAGIGGMAYEGIKQYMSFNSLMTQTFAQANVAYSKHKALTQDMANIAKETGRNFNDVANSLYRVASATSSWNNGRGASVAQLNAMVKQVENLQILGNLATGAQSDQAARIVGSIASTPGMQHDPKKIAAQVNAIVGSGDIRMSELITALGRGVLTSGSTMGLNLKQIGAYIDLLTTRGTTGASAGTYVAHAFQLLAGSTTQSRNWQAAIGIRSGEMEKTMREKGLTAAVQLLTSHMTKLSATPYLVSGKFTGQAAAEHMMQKAGLSPEQIAAWESGNMSAADKAAVLQTEMTAMFGGGRQAMPLMALMQSVSGVQLGYSKNLTTKDGGNYQSILAAINRNSTSSNFNKDLSIVQNSPRVQEQKLLRTLQWDLIQFGKAVTPVWLEMLKAGTAVLGFLGKFKGYLVEIGAVLASILLLVAAKETTKLALKGMDLFGAAKYHSARMYGARTGEELHFKDGSWANRYANKRGLKYGSDWHAKQDQIALSDARIGKLEELLGAAGSEFINAAGKFDMGVDKFISGHGAKLGDANWRSRQMMNQYPWNAGADMILPTGTKISPSSGMAFDSSGARILGSDQLSRIEEVSQTHALRNLSGTYGSKEFFGMSTDQRLKVLRERYQHQQISKRSPIEYPQEHLNAVLKAEAERNFYAAGGMTKKGNSLAKHMAAIERDFAKTGIVPGLGLRTVESERGRSNGESLVAALNHDAEALDANTRAMGGRASRSGSGGGGGSAFDITSKHLERTANATESAAKTAEEEARAASAFRASASNGSGILGKLTSFASKDGGGILSKAVGLIAGDGAAGGALGAVSKVGGLASKAVGFLPFLGEGALGAAMGPLGMALPLLMPLITPYLSKMMPHVVSTITNTASSVISGVGSAFGNLFGGPTATPPAKNIATAKKGNLTKGGVGFKPDKANPLLTPAILFTRAAVLKKHASDALKRGDIKGYMDYTNLANRNLAESAVLAHGGKAGEKAIETDEIKDLLTLRKKAAKDGGGYAINSFGRGYAISVKKPSTYITDGMQFHGTTGIDAEIQTLSRRVGYINHPQTELLKNLFGKGNGKIHPSGTFGPMGVGPLLNRTGDFGTNAFVNATLGLQSNAHKKATTYDLKSEHGFGGGKIVDELHGLPAMLAAAKREHGKEGSTQQDRAATVLMDAAKTQKDSQIEAAKSSQDAAKGNLNGAKLHADASKKLQDASTKLGLAGATMVKDMHLDPSTFSNFESAMSSALKSSGMGTEIAGAIQNGIKTAANRK